MSKRKACNIYDGAGYYSHKSRSSCGQIQFIFDFASIMPSEARLIQRYKIQIAEVHCLGNEQGKLRQRDFVYLSEKMESLTGIRISVSTLKRLWKNENTSQPHPATLNALVSLLGYEDWQAFKSSEPPIPNKVAAAPRGLQFSLPWVVGSLSVVGLLCFLVPGFLTDPGVMVRGVVHFRANKTVDAGVPNTVVFEYDLNNVSADSFFIQQSWNEAFREAVDPDKQHYTSLYYYPGYHKAKLIANDSIIAVQPIHLLTDGWMPFLQTDHRQQKPRYLPTEWGKRDGPLRVEMGDLVAEEVDLAEPLRVTFRRMQNFGELHSSNVQLQARLSALPAAEILCPQLELVLHCEKHIMYVPLTSKGCISNLNLKLGERYIDGRNHDLSMLGVDDLEAWQDVRLEIRDQHAQVMLNEKLVYELDYEQDFGLVKGLDVRFEGAGALAEISLQDGAGKLVFAEKFE
ncbi:MAG: hypothetical protein AAGM67_05720 [Bacteroidota bacterium]